jgi:hypothetical protein
MSLVIIRCAAGVFVLRRSQLSGSRHCEYYNNIKREGKKCQNMQKHFSNPPLALDVSKIYIFPWGEISTLKALKITELRAAGITPADAFIQECGATKTILNGL